LVARVEELPQGMRDPGLMGVLGVVIPILAPLDIGLLKLVGHACHSFLREASLTMRCREWDLDRLKLWIAASDEGYL
jgi:hypothetical protein